MSDTTERAALVAAMRAYAAEDFCRDRATFSAVADEIKRLEAQATHWQQAYRDALAGGDALKEQIAKLEQLWATAESNHLSADSDLQQMQVRVAELEREPRALVSMCQAFEAQRDEARAEADSLRQAINAHNESCADACGVGDSEGVRCGYRPYFPRRCPECPKDWMIGIDAARLEGRGLSAGERAANARLTDEIARLERENNWLRAYTGQSAKACVYCGLGADEQGQCERGFPGCGRADDQMLCREVGVAMERDELKARVTVLEAELQTLHTTHAALAEVARDFIRRHDKLLYERSLAKEDGT